MALIVLIVLLSALGICSASNNAKERRFDREQEQRLKERALRYDAWRRKVVDCDLERKLQDAAFSMDRAIWDEVKEINAQYGLDLNPFGDRALYAMLARRGKIHHYIAETGFFAVGAAYSTMERLKRDDQVKYLHMIDEELGRHGVEESMVFRPELHKQTVPMDQHKYWHGRFLWPSISDTVI